MPLLFLMRLLRTQLPVQVVEPEEIRDVSVLIATGLIEARITALQPAGRYTKASIATVEGITDEGLAEIAKLGDIRNFAQTSMRFSRGARLM
ncbi:hypothetical protein ASC78_01325 [Variovorax sp. Root318D1]|uniref:hypothetical protein n=1 Tax=Variovorax sp. Root318D1 TaxID=1736513 RepID=UPI0006F51521|nr:hypothetical protein [Variovorax sp. Root318D1]KQU91603.1 hypothetical protein ASC78_01325 [Variovorax sp. Root318D1]